MEFFKQNTQIDFMRLRQITAVISVLLFVFSIACLAINGLNWGLDFSGGTEVHLQFPQSVITSQIHQQLNAAGYHKVEVQSYGSSRDVLITVGLDQTHHHAKPKSQTIVTREVTTQLKKLFPNAHLQDASGIGAKVSRELANKGLLAILVSMLLISIYIAFRFEYRMAVSAAVALIHDPIVILGIFSFFHIEFDLTALAALLAVIGYSLNDTIVVFDRVRENFRVMRGHSPISVVNQAINQTLSRTVMTSALTLVVVLALLFLGGPMIRSFSIALVIGIVIGTYSSIYVAGALAVAMGLSRQDLLPSTAKNQEELP